MVGNKFEILGEITARCPKGKEPILVGGSAVELYTGGAYKSLDMDILGDREVLSKILEEMKFEKQGRVFFREDVCIDIVGNLSTRKKVNRIKLSGTKYAIKIIGVEDALVDRLCACKFWKSQSDCEQAILLLRGYWKIIDKKYLNKRVKEEMVSELLKDYVKGI
ncbi:MAG: hypothetical protein HY929_06140 [Euryarchaeota archaeon]|nr:hypothetical protein [Euryarchaeota archaeon]